MEIGCLMGLGINSMKIILSGISLVLAFAFLVMLKRYFSSTKVKLMLIYGHLAFLIFPAVLFTTNTACWAFCMSCYNNTLHLLIYALPTTLVATTLAGLVVIPSLYIFSNKKRLIRNRDITGFVRRYAGILRINVPKVYAVKKATPLAFSFRSLRSAIFLSVGMLDILNRKEIEAVLLHEMAHIKQRASALKFSGILLKIFSPLSLITRFQHDPGREEESADSFVIKIQGTHRYISSAKKKIREFEQQAKCH